MQNIESKHELRDLGLARSICRAIGATPIHTVEQIDTYFRVPSGRLKKRESPGEPTEWIFYERPDRLGARTSQFTIYPEPAAQARFGTTPPPVWLVVRKIREIHLIGNVRIHLDSVDGLGDFIEFEALVSGDYPTERCRASVEGLRESFGPALGEPIACGYSDLLGAGAA